VSIAPTSFNPSLITHLVQIPKVEGAGFAYVATGHISSACLILQTQVVLLHFIPWLRAKRLRRRRLQCRLKPQKPTPSYLCGKVFVVLAKLLARHHLSTLLKQMLLNMVICLLLVLVFALLLRRVF